MPLHRFGHELGQQREGKRPDIEAALKILACGVEALGEKGERVVHQEIYPPMLPQRRSHELPAVIFPGQVAGDDERREPRRGKRPPALEATGAGGADG